ncbi:MAG: GTP pyrophosphokinase family protein [Clostridium sp.]|jgi:putative GTP pyrophosphokinase|nr:GTP pyrophosphokinase family protein [Clostridium sp.]
MDDQDFQKVFLKQIAIPDEAKLLFDKISNFQELMMMYQSAIREVTTKLAILNDELSLGNRKNPIQTVKSRIKKPKSIFNKLQKLEQEISIEAIKTSLNDVAGIRVTCSFIDDVYRIAEMLTKQDDITVVQSKDYIENPKPNGYRSYHLILEVPVFFSNGKQQVRVELQIRTVAMDFWASLEHELRYKKDLGNITAIEDDLRSCAETISQTDAKMLEIRKRIEAMSELKSKINHES